MWFKNIQAYRLAAGWAMSPGTLEAALVKQPLMPCTGMSIVSRGWVPPAVDAGLVASQGKHLMIALGVEEKILPPSVISDEVKLRAIELEKIQGYKPGKKQLRDLAERVTTELLPRALAKRRVTRAWIDPVNRWVVVDAASPSRAEEVLEHLRNTLGELPVTRLETNTSTGGTMTQWLTTGEAPGAFELDSECELKASGEGAATVRYLRHDLSIKEIRDHISGGKFATRLGLLWKDRISLLLAEPFQVRGIKSLALDHTSDPDQPSLFSPADQFAADFELMAGEFVALLAGLVSSLGGFRESSEPSKVVMKPEPQPASAPSASEVEATAKEKPAPFNGEAAEDPLYEQAVEVVKAEQKGSVSMVQRRLSIGYNRAARLIERMEQEKILSVPNAAGIRTLLSKDA